MANRTEPPFRADHVGSLLRPANPVGGQGSTPSLHSLPREGAAVISTACRRIL